MTILYRNSISSDEEAWVKACHKFFEAHGAFDWYTVDRKQAVAEIMKNSGGRLNPVLVRKRVDKLYDDTGVRQL
jgi:hypothetical protein